MHGARERALLRDALRAHDAIHPEDRGRVLAGKLLPGRIAKVYAPALLPWPVDDEDLIHDVRVAARRLREAVALLAPVLNPRSARRIARRARELARAFSEPRAFDVVLHDFRRVVASVPIDARACGLVEKFIVASGRKARLRTREAYPSAKLIRHGVDALAMARDVEDETVSLAALVPAHLSARLEAVSERLRSMETATNHVEQHELRLKLKHLRYALEVLNETYGNRIRGDEVLPKLRFVQDTIGSLCDVRDLREIIGSRKLARRVEGQDLAILHEALGAEELTRFGRAKSAVEIECKEVLAALGEAFPRGVLRAVS